VSRIFRRSSARPWPTTTGSSWRGSAGNSPLSSRPCRSADDRYSDGFSVPSPGRRLSRNSSGRRSRRGREDSSSGRNANAGEAPPPVDRSGVLLPEL
jgi:hypothetical protein